MRSKLTHHLSVTFNLPLAEVSAEPAHSTHGDHEALVASPCCAWPTAIATRSDPRCVDAVTYDPVVVALTKWVAEQFDVLAPSDIAEWLVLGSPSRAPSH